MRGRGEAGFTLIEVIVVVALIAVIVAALGALFLGGATPAVAAAARDVTAAFDEARQTAVAFDTATVVFAPAATGPGYAARVYRREFGDPAFGAANGPDYASTVTVSETTAPLGSPGFAFRIDHLGNITAFRDFTVSGGGTPAACPATGKFTLRLADARDVRVIDVACTIALDAGAPLATVTAAPAVTPAPAVAWSCPSGKLCGTPSPLGTIAPPACPLGFLPDAGTPGLCDPPVPATTAPATPAPSASANPLTPMPPIAPTAAPSNPPGIASPGGPQPSGTPVLIEYFAAQASGPYQPHSASLYSNGTTCADGSGCHDVDGTSVQIAVTAWGCGAASVVNGTWAHYGAIISAATFEDTLANQDAADDPGDSSSVSTMDSYCPGYAL